MAYYCHHKIYNKNNLQQLFTSAILLEIRIYFIKNKFFKQFPLSLKICSERSAN